MKTLSFPVVANFRQIELDIKSVKYYLIVSLFVVLNILLPLIVHQITINGVIG
jgi:hypothetical protein